VNVGPVGRVNLQQKGRVKINIQYDLLSKEDSRKRIGNCATASLQTVSSGSKRPRKWRGCKDQLASARFTTNEWNTLEEREEFESAPTISFRKMDSLIRNRCLARLCRSNGSNRHRPRKLRIILSMFFIANDNVNSMVSISTYEYTLQSIRADQPRGEAKRSERGDRTRGKPCGGLAVME
jgi:hypothetical protein